MQVPQLRELTGNTLSYQTAYRNRCAGCVRVPAHVSAFPFPFLLPHIRSTAALPALPGETQGEGEVPEAAQEGPSSASAVNLGESLSHTQPNCEVRAFHFLPS